MLFLSYSFFTLIRFDFGTITPLERLSSIELTEESSNFRFYLWKNALDNIKDNFFGNGIGTWKIESLPYWNMKLSGYIVPYHAHNDFLELSTEIGLLGGIFYFLIFLSSLTLLFIKYFKFRFDIKYLILFLALTTYFIDAFFNFPLERTYMQICFCIIFSSSYFFLYIHKND